MKTVVGLFDTLAHANEAKSALLADGFTADEIRVMDQDRESYSENYAEGSSTHESLGERIKHFFSGFGEEDHSGHEDYTSGVERGGAILSAKVEDEEASDVADVLHRYGASGVGRSILEADELCRYFQRICVGRARDCGARSGWANSGRARRAGDSGNAGRTGSG